MESRRSRSKLKAQALFFLCAIVYSIPFSRLFSIPFMGVDVNVTDLLIIVGGVLTLSQSLTSGGMPVPRRPLVYIGLLLLIVGVLVSYFFAAYPTVTLRYLSSLFLKLLLFWLAYVGLRYERGIRIFIKSYVRMSVILALIAMAQILVELSRGDTLLLFTSYFDARNEMVFYLVPGFLLALGGVLQAHRRQSTSWILVLVIGIVLLVSRGRTGVFLATVLGGALFLSASRSPRIILRNTVIGLIGVSVLYGVAILYFGSDRMDELWDNLRYRYVSSVASEYSQEHGSLQARLAVLTQSLSYSSYYWLTGFGADNFKLISIDLIDLPVLKGTEIQPHNTYLGLFVGTGILGLSGFLALVVSGFKRPTIREQPTYILSLRLAYLAIVLNLATFDASHRYLFWLFLALMLALSSPQNMRPRSDRETTLPVR